MKVRKSLLVKFRIQMVHEYSRNRGGELKESRALINWIDLR